MHEQGKFQQCGNLGVTNAVKKVTFQLNFTTAIFYSATTAATDSERFEREGRQIRCQ